MKKNTLSSIILLAIWVMCISQSRAQDTDSENVAPQEPETSEVEPWVPEAEADDPQPEAVDSHPEADSYMDEPLVVDNRPYGKGAMELGLGLGAMGGGGIFELSVGASFAYYVVPRLAPGISLNYHAVFGDLEYPQSFTTLPYLKFVLIRSRKFAPYLIGAVGRDFQWGGTNVQGDGFAPIDAWIAGGGVGTHIGIGSHVALMIQVMFLYYFYEREVLIAGEDDPVDGHLNIPVSVGMSIFF